MSLTRALTKVFNWPLALAMVVKADSVEDKGQKSDNWVPSVLISSPPATLWAHLVVSGSR
jgi:hypothetical protein